MTEDVLQYIWRTQSFTKDHLVTIKGESLMILKQGLLNENSGPDFSSASIIIDDVEWFGDVEIHLKSSAWMLHKHQFDAAYNKVILHVVWEHDMEVVRADGSTIPTLVLNKLVNGSWLQKYKDLQTSIQIIPCEPFIKGIKDVYIIDAFNKTLIKRLQRKSKEVLDNVNYLKGDWEQATQDLLFEYFGFKKNNEAFKQLSSIIDYRIVIKLNSQKQMEAYLFGMAGLLQKGKDSPGYQEDLQTEFVWIRNKFAIVQSPMSVTWWKFMRLRPANFPTLRIAQLSALLYQRKQVFHLLIEGSLKDAAAFFVVEQSEFWKTHYHFHKIANTKIKGMGEQSALVLSINVAAVLLVAYGQYINNEQYIEKALGFLEAQRPETNAIAKRWLSLGIKLENAAESQGAIELFNNYCSKKRCLQCNIGGQVLGSR